MTRIVLTTLLFALAPPESERIVYLDSLLKSPTTHQEGLNPYRAADATFGDQRVRHGLMTDVAAHANVQARYSSVSFALGKKYQTFHALIGRDNNEANLGQSYCYFEVYADGKRVFDSPAMRSALTDTVAHGGTAHKVKTPQSVTIDVSSVEQLKLVVQLPEFRQTGYRINRASGCVWGEARLTLKPGEKRDDSASLASVADQKAKEAFRRAVGVLLRRLPPSSEPRRVAVAPLVLDSGAPGGPKLRELVAQLMQRRPSGPTLLTLLEPDEEKELAEKLTADTRLLARPAAIASIGRNVGADLVLLPALIDDDGWKAELRLLETADGVILASVQVPLDK
jgi:hypothetical protein